MGEKVNFNTKKNNSNRKKIKIIGIILICIFVIYFIIQGVIKAYKSLPNNNVELKKAYYNVSEYGSLEEILKNYQCKLVSKDETNGILTAYVSFNVNLYTGNTSNERHFTNLCRIIAEFQKFKNFNLIDNEKDINIEVKCSGTKIVELKINGDLNYYLNHDSEINSKQSVTPITRLTIQSKELQQLINENWDETKVDWGTRDSVCDNYKILFEEGIEYKTIGRQVFNVIYTSKYSGSISNNLNAKSTKEEVKNNLGEPTFNDNDRIYGYLGDNNYIFFDFVNEEVSIYPKVEVSEEDEVKLKNLINEMNDSSDIKEFVSELTDLWIDYDLYDFASDYVDLRYTLKGVNVKITSTSLKNGIYVHKNYSGNKDIKNLDNVYITDTDFVFEEEKSRSTKSLFNRNDDGEFSEVEEKYLLGTKFCIRFYGTLAPNEIGYKGPKFFSRDREYVDSELSSTLIVSSYIWYDDYNFIYSIDNDGIYVYNCVFRTNTKLEDIKEKIQINSVENRKIIYNDSKELILNVN